MNTSLRSCACMVYESLRIVLKIFVTFVKMLGRCENAIFIELLKF